MEKDKKTIITFALATLTPTIAWMVFIPLSFLTVVFLNPTALGPENLHLVTKTVRFIVFDVMLYVWTIFFAVFVLIFSVIHMLFLGIPTFLIVHRLKVLRWYTVLPASFFIGGAPYIVLMWGTEKDTIIGVALMMGCFGFIAGMAFWVLWCYWVEPDNYMKKVLP
jgi:hypothetical protein